MAEKLPPLDVAVRVDRVRETFGEAEIDALIVTSPNNIRWLTGFAGSSATVVVTRASEHLFTDARYALRAPEELEAAGSRCEVIVAPKLADGVRDVVADVERVGLEADHISWAVANDVSTKWLPDQDVIATTELIAGLRAVKAGFEIARIRAAAGIVDRALAGIAPRLTASISERTFARELDAAIRAEGAEDLGFDTIVASGPNGAIPHHSPGDRIIERGDMVIVDVGARVDGYRSDMTRTFSVGPLSAERRRHYDVVIAAQQAGVDAMRADVATKEVDAAARNVIVEAGWGDMYTHGTGHGVGLDIHELPRVSARATDCYEVGTVATVEPGVYLPGVAGVRIEDTCLVTKDGAERLTGFSKVPEL